MATPHAQRSSVPATLAAFAVALVACATAFAQAASAPYVVIVNPQNEATALERNFLSRAFVKKVSRWPDGSVIRPVDLPPDSPVRRRFSLDVLGRSVAAVRNGWQQAIFSGRDVPPPELESDAAVVDYVLRYPGAIGYVSPEAALRGARPVEVR